MKCPLVYLRGSHGNANQHGVRGMYGMVSEVDVGAAIVVAIKDVLRSYFKQCGVQRDFVFSSFV